LDEGHWQKSSHVWHNLADALAPKCLEGLSDLGLSEEQTENLSFQQRAKLCEFGAAVNFPRRIDDPVCRFMNQTVDPIVACADSLNVDAHATIGIAKHRAGHGAKIGHISPSVKWVVGGSAYLLPSTQHR
jgi:hypothetical protein